MLADLRGDADLVIDTTDLNVHQLDRPDRRGVRRPQTHPRCKATVVSFGFKYGIPVDADLVADMRFLPNPHWVPELRAADRPRRRRSPTTSWASPAPSEFLDALRRRCSRRSAAGYLREGKRFMTVAVGCTGGKHRSVAMAEEIAAPAARAPAYDAGVVHRDLGRE